MINCIAIDDEPLALEILDAFCAETPFLKLDKTFTDAGEAARYLRKFPVDLLFLDIQMPDINGLEFHKLHAGDRMVIFTTAYSEYAVEGFTLNAVDYLLKPIEKPRFFQAVQKAQDYYNYTHAASSEQQHLFVRSEYNLVKIPLADILYIETLDDYLKIHLPNRKPVLTKMNLKNIMNKLSTDFIRVHRSFVVPMKHIRSVRGKTIHLEQKEIPIGIKFEEEFFKKYGY
ncbi:MAG: LytR/AlgR family response regulator transcription factor [Bacteroidia bacterium]